jgi:hypothetical protein
VPALEPVHKGTNLETGHLFEVYRSDGISWEAADFLAKCKSVDGIPGHLATITSSGEDKFVDELREGALSASPISLSQGQVWVGGFQVTSPPQVVEPFGGWRWVNDEGPFPGTNTGPGYTNWSKSPVEPNNSGGNENHLTLGRFGLYGGWNDEGAAVATIGGYIVEYDLPRTAACDPLLGTCQTIEGQTLIFPAGSFAPGAKIRFTAYEFTDPRGGESTCGLESLTLFGPAYNKPELRIPPYLCGSPKFIVVAVDGSELNIKTGTVSVENFTDEVPALEGNRNTICNDPIPAGVDPQDQDVIVYQTTDPARMRESYGATGVDQQFVPGAAGEFTNACGSSRGSTKEPSYFVVGMHIDFGALGSTPAGNHQSFVSLTLYKLSLLQQSVNGALAAGVLKNGDAEKMTSQLENAVVKLGRGDAAGALQHVQKFLTFVVPAIYNPPTSVGSPLPPDVNNNYNGEHFMRGSNIEFTLRVKVVPYAP